MRSLVEGDMAGEVVYLSISCCLTVTTYLHGKSVSLLASFMNEALESLDTFSELCIRKVLIAEPLCDYTVSLRFLPGLKCAQRELVGLVELYQDSYCIEKDWHKLWIGVELLEQVLVELLHNRCNQLVTRQAITKT